MRTEIFPTTWNGPNSEYPIADGQHISSFFMHGKFNVTGNFSNGEYILVIDNVTTADQGDYTCDIVVDGKPLQHTVKLQLEQPTKQIAIDGSDNVDQVHGTEGQLITLTCTVKNGHPGETLSWSSNGTVVKVGGLRILILEWFAKRSDHLQNYTCMANNTAMQEPLERTIQLVIAYKPVLSTNGSDEIKSLEGQSLYVTCAQSSNPPSSKPKWWLVDAIGITRLFSNSHILYIKIHHLSILTTTITPRMKTEKNYCA
ncbi:sialic acid-binding Ig-like lectin 10 [Mytilus trossulus]|uniref:sialic acid-binding Ig-like lectin 10 n=1 Tax=Mytilus trossulus TaxID=6551 RepID=UPI0030068324